MAGALAVWIPVGSESSGRPSMGLKIENFTDDDLHGARVTIDYVQRASTKIDSAKHAQFWSDWVSDNQGKPEVIHHLQG
jgi:hypothetical protein